MASRDRASRIAFGGAFAGRIRTATGIAGVTSKFNDDKEEDIALIPGGAAALICRGLDGDWFRLCCDRRNRFSLFLRRDGSCPLPRRGSKVLDRATLDRYPFAIGFHRDRQRLGERAIDLPLVLGFDHDVLRFDKNENRHG